MNFLIRKVILSEVEILQQLTIKTFLEAYSETNNAISMKAYIEAKFSLENLSRELKQTNSEFYFIEHKSEKMGFLKLNIGSSQTEPMPENTLEIERIYVIEKHQGKKIGKSLLEFSIQYAKMKSVDFIWLGVWEHNQKAIEFYKRNQFEVFSSHTFILGEEHQIDLLMKRSLK
jgi:ribosomal protein S18 acetylase RimI-like enzyme